MSSQSHGYIHLSTKLSFRFRTVPVNSLGFLFLFRWRVVNFLNSSQKQCGITSWINGFPDSVWIDLCGTKLYDKDKLCYGFPWVTRDPPPGLFPVLWSFSGYLFCRLLFLSLCLVSLSLVKASTLLLSTALQSTADCNKDSEARLPGWNMSYAYWMHDLECIS